MSELFNVSGATVRRVAKDLYPELFENGKRTIFNQQQSLLIGDKIRKQGYIQPLQNGKVPIQNEEVVTKSDLKDFAKDIVKSVLLELLPMINNNQKQLEYKQDYYSIIGYANSVGIKDLTFSEAVRLGKCAGQKSRDQEIEIRKIPDERFGKVNSYRIDVLQEVFSI